MIRKFIEGLGAQVRNDRCCDTESCQCICHFQCRTLKDKKKEFRAQGYHKCHWESHKRKVLRKATEICMHEMNTSLDNCHDKEKSKFICPVQYICSKDKCLACIQPQCVSPDDKKIAKKLISEQTKIEQDETEKKYS